MSEPKHTLHSAVLFGVITVVVLFLGLMPHVLNHVRSGPSCIVRIIGNLRQLDGAKQQWALDHQTGAVEVTRGEIAGYLRHTGCPGWVQPVAGERYVLNSLTDFPEAVLTHSLEGKPEGTRLRLSLNESNGGL